MTLGIYGSGGSGREVKEIADLLRNWEEMVFIDDTVKAGVYQGIRRMPFEFFCQIYDKESVEVVIALGEPEYKISLYNKVKEMKYRFANVIHPTSWVSPTAKIEEGIIIKAGVIVSCNTIIKSNVGIEPFVSVGHDCVIGENCQISSGVLIGGRSQIGSGTYVGMNVPIKESIKIGANSVIGMGSVVQRDIPGNVIALGNPARPMKHKDGSKVFG